MIVLFRFRFFRYFRAFTHYKLSVSFRSLNFGFNINIINPLLVIISSKLPAITNVMHKLVLWVCRLFQISEIFECYTNKRIKNALEIGYQHFKRSPSFNIFVVKYQFT